MKYFIGIVLLLIVFTSCSLFSPEGACEEKNTAGASPPYAYSCRNLLKIKCEALEESYLEVYFHEGLTCIDIGYTYQENENWFWTGSSYDDLHTPSSDGYWADDAGGGGGASYCTDSYEGPTDDIQRDSYCQAAYAYLCIEGLSPDSEEVSSNCEIYNSSSWGYTGNCPYCP